jgi:hypothetical protein
MMELVFGSHLREYTSSAGPVMGRASSGSGRDVFDPRHNHSDVPNDLEGKLPGGRCLIVIGTEGTHEHDVKAGDYRQHSRSSWVTHGEQATSATIAAAAVLSVASIFGTTAKDRGLAVRCRILAPFPGLG